MDCTLANHKKWKENYLTSDYDFEFSYKELQKKKNLQEWMALVRK